MTALDYDPDDWRPELDDDLCDRCGRDTIYRAAGEEICLMCDGLCSP